MSLGRLYKYNDERFYTGVSYNIQVGSDTNWWGELTPIEYRLLDDGSGYIIELEDRRRGRCHVKKRINRAVSGVPPRYIYHFTGTSPLEPCD